MRKITETRTGKIVTDTDLTLEYLYVGDYGKENNIKASFLGYNKRIEKVEHRPVDISDKLVVTVSSQKGCPMQCKFCDCPKPGFHGNTSLAERYYSMIKGKNLKELKSAQHVMQGKVWLYEELSKRSKLILTTGCDTANKRFDWNIEKSHSNDAICITGLKPEETEVVEYTIKPMRRQSKAKTDNVLGIKHHDLVEYTFKNGETHRGYVTALYPKLNALNFQSKTKHCKKVNAKKCKLLWKFNKIYWLKCA